MDLLEYLETATGTGGLRTVPVPRRPAVDGLRLVGGIQKKNLRIHRAVCIFTLDGSVGDPEQALKKAREYLHKTLKARFWRGLGLGVVVYSPDPLPARHLFGVVESTAEKITVLQWVANLTPSMQTLTAAYVWKQVSIPYVLDFIDGYMKLNESY